MGNSPSLSSRAPSQGLLSQLPLCVKWGKNFQVMRIHWQNFQELKRIFSFLLISDEMVFATLGRPNWQKGPLSTSLPFSGRKGAGCGDNLSNGFSIVAYSLPPHCSQPLWRESAMPLTALVPLELRQVQLGANGLLSPLHVRPRALDLAKLPGADHLRRKGPYLNDVYTFFGILDPLPPLSTFWQDP